MVVQFRRRNDVVPQTDMIISIDNSVQTTAMTYSSRSMRLLCSMAIFAAFLVGIGVGVKLPSVLAKDTLELPEHAYKTQFPTLSSTTRNYSNDNYYPALAQQVSTNSILNSIDSTEDDKLLETTISQPENEDTPQLPGSPVELLEDNIYLSSHLESYLPRGFSDQEVGEWRTFARAETVVRLQEGCGRMQNRLLTFANGSQSCCRYRQNFDQIQGEIFSFYLSRLLGINHVPPSTLGVVKSGSKQWSNVGNQLALAQWSEERPVVLTKFVPDLESSFIPSSLRPSSRRRLHPMDIVSHDASDVKGLSEMAQWSDLIIFDYLTANLDRVVNNLYNMQWNPSMMEAPAHNLAQHKESGLLVFLDNESGLLHGYRLLDKYESFHASLLEALCIFRKRTAKRVSQLASKGDIGKKLKKMFRKLEPELLDFLPTIPEKSIKILNGRLKNVQKQIMKCQTMYS